MQGFLIWGFCNKDDFPRLDFPSVEWLFWHLEKMQYRQGVTHCSIIRWLTASPVPVIGGFCGRDASSYLSLCPCRVSLALQRVDFVTFCQNSHWYSHFKNKQTKQNTRLCPSQGALISGLERGRNSIVSILMLFLISTPPHTLVYFLLPDPSRLQS